MVNIQEFQVNKTVLLLTILSKYTYVGSKLGNEIAKKTFGIIDALGEEDKNKVYEIIQDFPNNPQVFEQIGENPKISKAFSKVFETLIFEEIYFQTSEYKNFIEKCWKLYTEKIEEFTKTKLRMQTDKDIICYIIHPMFGTSLNDNNHQIFFGNTQGFKNPAYNVTMLMHEAMLCLFPYEKEWDNDKKLVCQNLIELAIDNEMANTFMGETKQYCYGELEGTPGRNKMLPVWCAFLGKNDKEVEKLNKLNNIDFESLKSEEEKQKFAKMTFEELMNYVEENTEKFVFNGKVTMKHNGINEKTFETLKKQIIDKNKITEKLEFEEIDETVEEEEGEEKTLTGLMLKLDGVAKEVLYFKQKDSTIFANQMFSKDNYIYSDLDQLLLAKALHNTKQNAQTLYLETEPNSRLYVIGMSNGASCMSEKSSKEIKAMFNEIF